MWKAVREFWLSLVPHIEQLDQFKGLRDQMAILKQRVNVLDQRCAKFYSEAEKSRELAQQRGSELEDKDRDIKELRMTLREVNDQNERERRQHHVALARFRASVGRIPTGSTLPFPCHAHRLYNVGD